MDLNKQCCQRVNDRGVWHRAHRCPYKGVIERDGKRYCRIHDPVKVLERRTAREEKWEADYRARADQYARSSDVVRSLTAREKVLNARLKQAEKLAAAVASWQESDDAYHEILLNDMHNAADLGKAAGKRAARHGTMTAALAAFQAQPVEDVG